MQATVNFPVSTATSTFKLANTHLLVFDATLFEAVSNFRND